MSASPPTPPTSPSYSGPEITVSGLSDVVRRAIEGGIKRKRKFVEDLQKDHKIATDDFDRRRALLNAKRDIRLGRIQKKIDEMEKLITEEEELLPCPIHKMTRRDCDCDVCD